MKRIIFLDYLRVLAFLSVLIGHKYYDDLNNILNYKNNHKIINFIFYMVEPIYLAGGAGVIIFFLVSGYIITKVAMQESCYKFIIKRFFRIYPLFILAVFLEMIFQRFINSKKMPSLQNILENISLVYNFFSDRWILGGIDWTLRYEVLFYLIMFVFSYFNVFKNKKVFFLKLLLLTFLIQYFGPIPNFLSLSRDNFVAYFPFIFMGSTFYLAEKDKSLVICCIGFSVYVILSFLILFYRYNKIEDLEPIYIIYGVAIFVVFYFFREKLFPSKIIILLSSLTYSLYIFHNWFWDFIIILISKYTASTFLISLFTPIILVGVCYLLLKFVELPGIRLGSNIVKLNLKKLFNK